MGNRRFGKGVKVIIKAGNVPAIIKEASGEKTWVVHPVNEEGNEIPSDVKTLKSQQLRHLKPEEAFPEAKVPPHQPKPKRKDKRSAAKKSSSEEATPPPVAVIEPPNPPAAAIEPPNPPAAIEPPNPPAAAVEPPNPPAAAIDPPMAPSPPKQRQNADSKSESSDESDDEELLMAGVNRRRAKLAARKEEEQHPISLDSSSDHSSIQPSDHVSIKSSNTDPIQSEEHVSVQSSNHSFIEARSVGGSITSVPGNLDTSVSEDSGDEEEADTDQRLDEDIPRHTDVDLVDEDGQPVIDPNDLLIVGGMEDEDKYAKKWREYEEDKARLIREGWTVERKAPMSQCIDIGEMVTERHGRKRSGEIIASDREEGGPPTWEVQFDGASTTESKVPSTALTLVRDMRRMTWKAVEDSHPEESAVPFQVNGVVVVAWQLEKASL
ncbi:hypothetical protein SEMRO_93_G048460.1 [Seminavis robusta]|uniref:Uncharacterized protein n=1 Tax=Seminavis robusta TaxID=568900 RepID=A0A9N8DHH7_9STRA|nr:hypothetical protein SEMRO_93_G048460.1 [Seminavis robusta]|eukprot:Sro93_g048460.1 n/a (436) ;mRNA; r:54478-55874